MSDKVLKSPQIRFAGYTDNWEESVLGESMMFSNGINAPKENYGKGRKMISVMDILAEESITYEKIRNSVSVDKKIEDKNKVENGDLIFVRSSEVSEEVGWAKAYLQDEYALYSGFSIRGKRTNNYDAYFMELSLNNVNRKHIESKAGGSTRFNVSQEILKSIIILQPTFSEQVEISSFFSVLDHLITLQKQKLGLLKETKKSLLQKMFPREGANVPEVRFTGYTDAWEQRNFFDNIEKTIDFRGRTPKKLGLEWSESGYLALSALNVKNGYIDYSAEAHFGDGELYRKWMKGNELKKGQVLFTTEAPMGNVTQIPDDKGYILSQRTIAFVTKAEKLSDDFLAVLLKSPNVYNKLSSFSSGGTAKGVSQRSLKALEVKTPIDTDEQKKMGILFKEVNYIITLQQRELNALKNLKKSLLHQMFV